MVISIHALRGEGDELSGNLSEEQNISIHALRGEGDQNGKVLHFLPAKFQSTPSVGRATSIYTSGTQADKLFQSTPSVGRATQRKPANRNNGKDFNPRPPWGGRLKSVNGEKALLKISIHALRGEGDRYCRFVVENNVISIHALRGEGDFEI